MEILIYLYRLGGEPQYVGQTMNLENRDRRHTERQESIFDKFLQSIGRDKFTLEVIGQVEDVPQGSKANELENQMMDLYQTFCPESGKGYNFGRAGLGFVFKEGDLDRHRSVVKAVMNSEPVRQIMRDAWDRPGARKRRAAGLRAAFGTDQARINRIEAQKERYERTGGMPEETRQKLSLSLQGKEPGNKGKKQLSTIGENNPAKRPEVREKLRFKRSDETKEKMSAWQRGKPKSEEAKEAMKLSWFHRLQGNFIDIWEAA